ncbi:hypothetical protein KVR01_008227 [Diaporthe batatas]|uniref:uncharacterized protein n=1 Tax=Diaporthe batatas TaxID=748121 RepID=UPI001D056877|nr:uncharacterized protein KVR01_008227 [Diaporthe batatas]KAG8162462.1 hypothetical protein KVR01_008227 [Diaporthe batatas]
MAPADWTDHDREVIEFGWRLWKLGGRSRRNAVTSTAMKCGDITGAPDAWFAAQWPQQIGRYYANRDAAENGRPRAQAKTREQVALLEYAFAQTHGYPYTGEVLPLAFLTGLQVRQVKSWFEHERKKCVADEDFLPLQPPEIFGMLGQATKDAAALVRLYNKDPRECARSLVMWERCVRTGHDGGPESETMQRPRPYYKKYWNRMFLEDGTERSLLEATEELEGDEDDNDSLANLTSEERSDIWKQIKVQNRQFAMNQRELGAEAKEEEGTSEDMPYGICPQWRRALEGRLAGQSPQTEVTD